MRPVSVQVQRLGAGELALMRSMLTMFGEAFGEPETYGAAQPTDEYLSSLLGSDHLIALAAIAGGEVVGGLAAYVLDKFEQMRREVYIYDLAVAEPHRRTGIATALIEALMPIAVELGAYVLFVQADPVDGPAVALYSKLGTREDVLHFDIAVG